MLCVEDINGVWIGDDDSGLYEELFLSGDGTGWFEYGRSTYTVISEFTWRRSAPNLISFEYGEKRELDHDGVTFGWEDDPSSHAYELVDGEILRFTPPYRGVRDYRRGKRGRPFVW